MPSTDTDAIHQLLDTYERSLNTSDASLAASCYTQDGVFMPTTLPTASGSELEASYAQIFRMIRLDVKFTIDEIEIAGPDSAYGLTRSSGSQTVLETGTTITEENREIFVFQREEGSWKIARYMFNKAD